MVEYGVLSCDFSHWVLDIESVQCMSRLISQNEMKDDRTPK